MVRHERGGVIDNSLTVDMYKKNRTSRTRRAFVFQYGDRRRAIFNAMDFLASKGFKRDLKERSKGPRALVANSTGETCRVFHDFDPDLSTNVSQNNSVALLPFRGHEQIFRRFITILSRSLRTSSKLYLKITLTNSTFIARICRFASVKSQDICIHKVIHLYMHIQLIPFV